MKKYQSYKCAICGNEVEVQNVGGGKLVCCGEPMGIVNENVTAVNLMKAFAGESMARNKYQFFAELAEKEGYHAIARHFMEASENERWHAIAQFKLYNNLINGAELNSTLKNIEYAMAGEHYEYTTMYPEFAALAEAEGLPDIARIFRAIAKVEVEHEREYGELKAALEADGFFSSKEDEYWVCEVCGHVHRGKKAPGVCPLCKVSKEYFKRENLH
jgi:desulfoferrodoxin-like iron-binding protein